jgi:DnaJ-class molecular chaperone
MSEQNLNEKKYIKSEFEPTECPRCHGFGLDAMAVFNNMICPICGGTGTIMRENSRSQETAIHTQNHSNDSRKQDWLFS